MIARGQNFLRSESGRDGKIVNRPSPTHPQKPHFLHRNNHREMSSITLYFPRRSSALG